MIPGTVRKGVEVTSGQLASCFPGTSGETLEMTRIILQGTIPDILTDASCAAWGVEAQRKYGELSQRSLGLIDNDEAANGARHLARMQNILTEISQALQSKPQSGFLSKLRRAESPRETLDRYRPELNQIRGLLDQIHPTISATRTDLSTLEREFTELSRSLDAHGLAARYIADRSDQLFTAHPAERRQTMQQSLLARSLSLIETVAHIQQGNLLREQSKESLRQLAERIQNGALNTLPSWLESIAFALRNDHQTDTELYTLRQGLDKVLDRIR